MSDKVPPRIRDYNKENAITLVIILTILGLMAWGCHDERQRCLGIGETRGRRVVQDEAVRRGYGQWIVKDGVSGTLTFQWNSSTNSIKHDTSN